VVLDVTSPSAVRALIERERSGLVFYTSYDKARSDITLDGARIAARAVSALGGRFVFISTDLVFDGATGGYTESMPATPLMPYGQLKLGAEAAVRDAAPSAVVLRPSLMWGESGERVRPAYECDNLQRGEPIDAYVDEWRTPVHVDDVARAAWELGVSDAADVFHLGGPERLSRLELARRLVAIHRFDPALVKEAKRPEDRPRDTSLDSTRLLALLEWTPRKVAAQTLAIPEAVELA
jgi:dTDP-4-dehydrorhamnose reductase